MMGLFMFVFDAHIQEECVNGLANPDRSVANTSSRIFTISLIFFHVLTNVSKWQPRKTFYMLKHKSSQIINHVGLMVYVLST